MLCLNIFNYTLGGEARIINIKQTEDVYNTLQWKCTHNLSILVNAWLMYTMSYFNGPCGKFCTLLGNYTNKIALWAVVIISYDSNFNHLIK